MSISISYIDVHAHSSKKWKLNCLRTIFLMSIEYITLDLLASDDTVP